MELAEWEPVYEAILREFGFDRSADERARDVLAEFATPISFDRFAELSGATVAIAGGGPSMEHETATADRADFVVAASVAADFLLEAGIDIDLMVTDLDKNVETAIDLSHAGVPVAVHAHGDNIPALGEYLPEFEQGQVLATTQAAPTESVYNFGGFTDGDRAAFLADEFGADELQFPGWDLDDEDVDPVKRQKLAWAERLLYWLETRRDERFAVLDGRRGRIDTTDLPL
ncbi:6-hydroxymethylpterin diphosphokinase MptE-like protein [Natranaeroarchaeum sulfidigenes]|uniref:6-hydroxymethyl-7,8-dihydropterin pyrophosphokinase n=1 Tax=Natranaeroarchaeum sulfidigenes TaxID=2784880 RepID=A0A897MRI3_9EURY|nr:6-hydroxymethylpterin diphosphokinase MptE-like protein [Natranaeroarchaeum sulfidigenes]QSG02628.1 putative Rossmann fold enzyme [Natranaeroarchaeum sulfidigenes]